MKNKKIVIMVSSSVYGIEELLERIYAILTTIGYEVWMSHKGTLPIYSNKSAFENCLYAVEKCDLFLSIISPQYGSGKNIEDEVQPEALKTKPASWTGQQETATDSTKNADELDDLEESDEFEELKESDEIDIDALLEETEIPDNLGQQAIDSIRQHLEDSALAARNSLERLRKAQKEEDRAIAQAKVDYINKVIADMWSDGKSILNYLAANRTATQVRIEANKYKTKAEEVRNRINNFESGDPRAKTLGDYASMLELISNRLPQTDGVKRKMDRLSKDVTASLNAKADEGDLIID